MHLVSALHDCMLYAGGYPKFECAAARPKLRMKINDINTVEVKDVAILEIYARSGDEDGTGERHGYVYEK